MACVGGAEEEVVMRKPRNVFEPSERQRALDNSMNKDGEGNDGSNKKRVQWSESTDLREKLKVYRRSQLDMPLNYTHIALEEAREKEGVKRWRDSLQNGNPLGEIEDRRPSLDVLNFVAPPRATDEDVGDNHDGREGADAASCIRPSSSSSAVARDSGGVGYDEDLERQLLVIKSKSTKYTIQPAYSAAITTYKEWLSNNKNTKGLPEARISTMKSQLKIYQKVVKVYKDWGDQANDNSGHFDQISTLLQEAADLGTPPKEVAKTISEELADAENVKKQVDSYNNMVHELLVAREAAGKT